MAIEHPGFRLARRFCAVMVWVCWAAIALDAVYLLMQLKDLVSSLNGGHDGISFGVTSEMHKAGGAPGPTRSIVFRGSVVNLIFFVSSLFGFTALWSARVCFSGFARGEIFGRRTLRALQAFAISAFLSQFGPLAVAVVTTATIAGLGAGLVPALSAILAQLLSSGSAPNLVLLALLLALVAVLGRAVDVAEDHAAIV